MMCLGLSSVCVCSVLNFFFFLIIKRESFNLWCPLLMIAFYHQTQTPINFWGRQGLNRRSLLQLSETLPVELTESHCSVQNLMGKKNRYLERQKIIFQRSRDRILRQMYLLKRVRIKFRAYFGDLKQDSKYKLGGFMYFGDLKK